jgi:transcriptional regulator with XRE-family HTH domain
VAEDVEDRERLSEAMEDRRIELGMSWADVADEAKISIAHLRRIRTGHATLTPLAARKIEKGLRWKAGSVRDILGGQTARETGGRLDSTWTSDGMVEIPDDVRLADLPAWEAHVWRTPQLSVHQRRLLIDFMHDVQARLGI